MPKNRVFISGFINCQSLTYFNKHTFDKANLEKNRVLDILTYDDLPQGGFAGLRERRFVTDQRVFGHYKHPSASNGIGNFVYLADANFMPLGQTGLHPHREVDVISVMVSGRLHHEGSLEHGTELTPGMVQVQRAGGEGFSHNEINPDVTENHMIQLWVLPDESGEPAGYRTYQPKSGERVHIYGGPKGVSEHFYSTTNLEVINAVPGQTITHEGDVMAYITKGSGAAGDTPVHARSLLRADGLHFTAHEATQLILIYEDP